MIFRSQTLRCSYGAQAYIPIYDAPSQLKNIDFWQGYGPSVGLYIIWFLAHASLWARPLCAVDSKDSGSNKSTNSVISHGPKFAGCCYGMSRNLNNWMVVIYYKQNRIV